MTTLTRQFAVALGLMAVALPATAAPISALRFEKVSPGIGNAGQYNWNTGTDTYQGIVYTPNGNGSASLNHFVTFCIEQSQTINSNTSYNNQYHFTTLTGAPVPGSTMSGATADALRSMWAEFRDDLDGSDSAKKSAAFQHAVWHLLDPGYNPSLSGNTATYYSTYLNPANWLSGQANLIAMVNGNKQDQVLELENGYTVTGNGEIVPTPEPAALLLGLAVAPVVYLRRRLAARAG